mgnify:CR=1 FL=1
MPSDNLIKALCDIQDRRRCRRRNWPRDHYYSKEEEVYGIQLWSRNHHHSKEETVMELFFIGGPIFMIGFTIYFLWLIS